MNPELEATLEAARLTRRAAVDTEFVRDRTYFPELALVQIGARDASGQVCTAIVDPLKRGNEAELEAVVGLLSDATITKVFHSGGQDFEVLRYALGVVPSPIFDTQIAATELELGRQVGYAGAVLLVLGLELEKGAQRADWLRRPLPQDLLDYARADVEHLVPMGESLETQARDSGKLEAVLTRCAHAVKEAQRDETPAELAERIKTGNRIDSATKRRLEALAVWREGEARAHNVPRRWLATDEALLAIARSAPTDVAGLSKIREVTPNLRSRYARVFLEISRG